MNTHQVYKVEDLGRHIVTTVRDPDGKGSSSIRLFCERHLTEKELALVDEVCTDTLSFQRTSSLQYHIQKLKSSGYSVLDTDGVSTL